MLIPNLYCDFDGNFIGPREPRELQELFGNERAALAVDADEVDLEPLPECRSL